MIRLKQVVVCAVALSALTGTGIAAVTKGAKSAAAPNISGGLSPKTVPVRSVLNFEPNLGQTDPQVRYMGRGKGSTIFITDEGAVMTSAKMPSDQELRGKLGSYDPSKFVMEVQAIRMNLVGGKKPSAMKTDQLQENFSSYYIGRDQSKWLTHVPKFGRVDVKSVYPGVDISYYGKDGILEYDFIVAPGADTKQIQLAFSGQQSMQVAANGDLLLKTAHGTFLQRRPVVYQEIGGKRVEVASSYKIRGGEVGFELARYDATKELVIDPALETSSYFGGSGGEAITGTFNQGFKMYVTGYTSSTNFPTAGTSPAFQGQSDAFVATINNQTGAPIQSIYIGGSGTDISTGVSAAVNDIYSSYACIGGFTNSANYPLTANAGVPTYDQGFVGFVTCFQEDVHNSTHLFNSPPLASSYVGTRGTQVNGVSFMSDDATQLLIAGQGTRGYIFASPQLGINGGTYCYSDFSCYNSNSDLDGFIGTFRLLYVGPQQLSQSETGGTGDDAMLAVVGSTTYYAAVGTTQSTNLQLRSPIKGTKGGSNQNVMLFTTNFASYFGGNDGADTATCIKMNPNGGFVFGGASSSSSYPRYGSAFPAGNQGGYDATLTSMTTSGTVQYSTNFGGSGDDFVNAIDMHYTQTAPSNGFTHIYAAGMTQSSNLLTKYGATTALPGQSTLKGTSDAFVIMVRPDVETIRMLTYLGGSGTDSATGIGVADFTGNTVLVAGTTGGAGDFPTVATNGFSPKQPNYGGGSSDGFFSVIWTPNTVPVSLAAVDSTTGTGVGGNVPFSVLLTNCTSSDPLQTYWTATCNTSPTAGTMNFSFQSHYSTGTVNYDFVSGPDGTTALDQTITARNFTDRMDLQVRYDTTYKLTIATGGTGSGSATPASGTFNHCTTNVPIVATPAQGSTFAGWSVSSRTNYTQIANASLASTTVQSCDPNGGSIVATFTASAKTTPVITWATPTGITYGTPLSGTQLNATANVAGTFVYTPAAGAVLGAGSQPLSVAFTPTDTNAYNGATANVQIAVAKATPVVTWATPAPITVGTALSATQLNATANVNGSFVYNPAAGAMLGQGSQPLGVVFTPTDTANYNNATGSVQIQVNAAGKINPVLTWAAPAPIPFGSALGSGQLNATANVTGTFVYNPPFGAVPPTGVQTLSVTFTPADTATYNTVTANVSISIQANTASGIVATRTLARNGADVVVTVSLANAGPAAVTNVVLSTAKFGSITGTPLPQNVGTIAAGGVATVTLTLPGVAVGSSGTLNLGGTYTGGSYSANSRTTMP